jgi:hypothetical protein
MEPLIIVTWDVPGRRPSGRERPWVSPGRAVPPCESPHRGQDLESPPRTRLGGGGGTTRSDPQVFIGLDVAKAQLDVALRPPDDCWHVHNEESGIASLVERLRTLPPALSVLEATGGLEVPVTGALAEAGLPVVVVHPRHAREFANATGRLAKTATLDARGLAHFAEAVRPPPRPLPKAQAQALSAWLTRRPAVARSRRESPEHAGRRPPPLADAGRRGPGVGGLDPPGDRRAEWGCPR